MANDTFVMSARQAAELDHAFARNGWTPEEVKKLSAGTMLGDVRGVILGVNEIKPIEHLIDLDADPFVPEGWEVSDHRKGGLFKFSHSNVELYIVPDYRHVKSTIASSYVAHPEYGGDDDKARCSGKNLNANVLDYLLAHTELIPEEWKQYEFIYFWDTSYHEVGKSPHSSSVRYLRRTKDGWTWGWHWLGDVYINMGRTALRAN
jgi:hypothetical protein